MILYNLLPFEYRWKVLLASSDKIRQRQRVVTSWVTLHQVGLCRSRPEWEILLLALKQLPDCESLGGGHVAGTTWVSTPPESQQEKGTSTLQPQGSEFWQQLYELEGGLNSRKDHSPKTLVCCLVRPWAEDSVKLGLDSWPRATVRLQVCAVWRRWYGDHVLWGSDEKEGFFN